MSKPIEFIYNNGFSSEYNSIIEHPKPASLFIPSWYKKMPNTVGSNKEYGLSPHNKFASNSTLKGCSPFLDCLSAGYIYTLPIDVEFRKEGNNIAVNWRDYAPFITPHSPEQHPNFAFENKNMEFILKFNFPFFIKTPKGYSCLFTHPFNRYDLPFRTFSGIVDTDGYPGAVQFPFQFIQDFKYNFILEKGTPVCQILPFKREKWTSTRTSMTIEEAKVRDFAIHSKIYKSYKSQWWTRKDYK